MDSIALIPLIALLAGVLLELLLGKLLSNKAKGWLAFISGLTALAGTLPMIPRVQNASLNVTLLDWDRGIQLVYRIDGLSMVFCLMATVIGSAILLYCVQYMEHEPEGTTRFYALMLTFIAGLVNLVISANLLVAYVSWELIGLCSYFLVGFWYKNTAAVQGARKVLIITHVAGYGLLAGILLLFVRSGSYLWTDPGLQSAFTTGIFLLMLVSAMAKSVTFPLHTWIPEAMNAPTPVSALLHSACYVKAGVYLAARFYSLQNPWQPGWNNILLVLAAVTMLVGALFALAQTDLKRLLAYSTISQLGHILAGLSLGTWLGAVAGLFYCLSHGLFKGTLFLCAGSVQHAAGTRDMRKLGGLGSKMPFTMLTWLIAAAAIVGVPLTNGFVAKWLLFGAAMDSGMFIFLLVAWLVSVFTAFYMLKATASTFFGQMPDELVQKGVKESALTMKLGMGFLAALTLLFGIAPQILINNVVLPAVRGLGFKGEMSVTWFGIQTGISDISVTAGALVVLAAFMVGALIYAVSRPGKTLAAGVFTGGDPLINPEGNVNAADFSSLLENTLQPVYRISDPDPLYMAIWKSLLSGCTRLTESLGSWTEAHPLVVGAALAVLMAVFIWLR